MDFTARNYFQPSLRVWFEQPRKVHLIFPIACAYIDSLAGYLFEKNGFPIISLVNFIAL